MKKGKCSKALWVVMAVLSCVFIAAVFGMRSGLKSLASETGNASQSPKKTLVVGTDEIDEEAVYQALFDTSNHISVDLDISDEELMKLEEDYEKYSDMESESPIYRMANVKITIEDTEYVIEEVGVRMKGNTSRTDFYDSEEGIYNLINLKLSFSQTFDDEEYYGEDAKVWESKEIRKQRKNRTFATLEKLDFKWNRESDITYTREYYAMEMFKAYDVLAASMNLAKVDVSEYDFGVMYMYEPIDEVFINRHLPEEEQGGDLYKAAWDDWGVTEEYLEMVKQELIEYWGFTEEELEGEYAYILDYYTSNWHGTEYTEGTTYGVQDEDKCEFYNLDLKTNKKKSTNAALINLLTVLNKDEATEEEYNSVLDAENFAKFAAVSYFVGGPDDLRNNYNNHYIYFLPTTGKAILIPYDYDLCLGNNSDFSPKDSMTRVSPYSDMAEGNETEQVNPMYTLGIINEGYCLDEYKACLEDIYNSDWLTEEKFRTYYNVFENNYKNEVLTAENEYWNTYDVDFEFDMDNSIFEKTLEEAKENGNEWEYYNIYGSCHTIAEYFELLKHAYANDDVEMDVDDYDRFAYADVDVSIEGQPGTYRVIDEDGNELANGTYESNDWIYVDLEGQVELYDRYYLELTSGTRTDVYDFVNIHDPSYEEGGEEIVNDYDYYSAELDQYLYIYEIYDVDMDFTYYEIYSDDGIYFVEKDDIENGYYFYSYDEDNYDFEYVEYDENSTWRWALDEDGYLITQSIKGDEVIDIPEVDDNNNSNENSNTGNNVINGGNANAKPNKENVNVVIDDNKVPTVQKADANTNTGDANNMPMWIVIAAVSLLGIAVVGITIFVKSRRTVISE